MKFLKVADAVILKSWEFAQFVQVFTGSRTHYTTDVTSERWKIIISSRRWRHELFKFLPMSKYQAASSSSNH